MVLTILFIAGAVLYALVRINKHIFKISNNTVIMFTGGLGSGKTLFAVQTAVKKHRMRYRRWWLKKFLHQLIGKPFAKKPPLIYSSFPIASKWYVPLTKEHITLQATMREYSTVVIDEIGMIASQYDWNKDIVKNELNEFIRLFRHYLDGHLILTDQNSDNMAVPLKRRVNIIYNLDDLQKIIPIKNFTLIRTHVTPIVINEDVKNLKNTDVDERDEHHLWTFVTKKHYESRYFKHRYDRVPYEEVKSQLPSRLYKEDEIVLD